MESLLLTGKGFWCGFCNICDHSVCTCLYFCHRVLENLDLFGENLPLNGSSSAIFGTANLNVSVKAVSRADYRGDLFESDTASIILPPGLLDGVTEDEVRLSYSSINKDALFIPGDTDKSVGSGVISATVNANIGSTLDPPIRLTFDLTLVSQDMY